MRERRYSGLLLDFFGVCTSNMVETIDLFELRERMRPGDFLRAWASPEGSDLYRLLELGEIEQVDWNAGFGALLKIKADNLMKRLLLDLLPAYQVLGVVRDARRAGIRAAVISNSLGREPFDPYAQYDLWNAFDAVVLSTDLGVRKPDSAIFEHTVNLLGLSASECIFADDTEENLPPAEALGMTVIHALDELVVVPELRSLLELSR
ncbi:MAG TPA: HAD-IA family hydrolase [Actinocrinis sp.]|nr:HAD-IA family hydrolase [Actinocrinis sp.]